MKSETPELVEEAPPIGFDYNLARQFYNVEQGRYDHLYDNVRANFGSIKDAEARKRNSGITTKPQGHMTSLANIVGTAAGKQDIKRINEAMTVEGARDWIQRSKGRKRYTAEAVDIDNDGISDVLVKDAAGNLVIVNGYTVKPSDYPLRKLYYSIPKEERKQAGGFHKWVRDGYYKPDYDDAGIHVVKYGTAPGNDNTTISMKKGGFKMMVPGGRTPYQAFSINLVKTRYEYFIDYYNLRRADGKKPNIFIKVLARCWNHLVVFPILLSMCKAPLTGQESQQELIQREQAAINQASAIMNDREQLKNTMKTKQFKQMIADVVFNLLSADIKAPDVNRNIDIVVQKITKEEAVKYFTEHPSPGPRNGFGVPDEVLSQANDLNIHNNNANI